MLWMYVKIILFFLIAIITFGFIVPFMLSYNSDEMVISGILLIIIIIPFEAFILIRILLDLKKIKDETIKIGKRILKGAKK